MDVKPFGASQDNWQNHQNQHITVVMELENNTIKFKVKPSTKASKIFKSYCERRNLTPNSFKIYNEDGERVNMAMTVGELKLVDGSVLTLQRQQTGGNQNSRGTPMAFLTPDIALITSLSNF